jgi:hypothetical protein
MLLLRRRRDFLLLLPIVCFLLFQEDLLLQLFELGSVPGKKTLRISDSSSSENACQHHSSKHQTSKIDYQDISLVKYAYLAVARGSIR